MLRTASSALIKEMLRSSNPTQGKAGGDGMDQKEYEEVERRLGALVRLERIWGRSGIIGGSTASVSGGIVGGGNAISAAGEERERKYFNEALRDGYVLCQ